jgi:anti-anti-sigma regulatory factor
MAKYRHRVFEMYEFRDEAICALTPKVEKAATEATAPESWDFTHLAVSRSAGVTLVEVKQATDFGDDNVKQLAEDFAKLADKLDRDSKVLLDFTGLGSLNSAFVDALMLFTKKLQTKGSRIALCSLDTAAREIFFAAP